MAIRKAHALWDGSLKEGRGSMSFGSFESPFTWASRFEEAEGSNPEELLGAAHAGCFSMSLSSNLGKAGFTPRRIQTRAEVHLDRIDGKATITKIHLDSEAQVPEISDEKFQEIATFAKENCPVSMALAGVEITMYARLI